MEKVNISVDLGEISSVDLGKSKYPDLEKKY